MRIEIIELYPHEDILQSLVGDVAEGLLEHVQHPAAVAVELYCRVAIKPVSTTSTREVQPDAFRLYRAGGHRATNCCGTWARGAQ